MMAANNVVGTLQPVEELAHLTKLNGVLFHTDAVQAAGKIPLDVNQLHVDLLSLSAHKLHGPKGIGALYVRKGTRLSPVVFGGGQERRSAVGNGERRRNRRIWCSSCDREGRTSRRSNPPCPIPRTYRRGTRAHSASVVSLRTSDGLVCRVILVSASAARSAKSAGCSPPWMPPESQSRPVAPVVRIMRENRQACYWRWATTTSGLGD